MKTYDFNDPVHCVRYIARNPLTGGYENILITESGNYLCSKCVKNNYKKL